MPVRAGLWPRAIALLIDGCLITFVLGSLGILFCLYRLAAESGSLTRWWVLELGMPPNLQVLQDLNIPLPPNFQVTHLVRCTKTLLGYVHDRVLIVAEITRSGATTTTRELTFPLDAEGLPRDRSISILYGSWFCGLHVLLEWQLATLGKDLMDIRVQSSAGGPPTLVQAIKRFLVRFFPTILLGSLSLMPIAGVSFTTAPALFWFVGLVSLLSFMAVQVNFIVEVRRRALPGMTVLPARKWLSDDKAPFRPVRRRYSGDRGGAGSARLGLRKLAFCRGHIRDKSLALPHISTGKCDRWKSSPHWKA